MELKNISVKVNSDQFKIVQKIAFHYGCTWDFNGLVRGASEYLSINENSKLTWDFIVNGNIYYNFEDFVLDFEYKCLFEYPIYKIDKDKNVIFKFTDKTVAECIYSASKKYKSSQFYTNLEAHFCNKWLDISKDQIKCYIDNDEWENKGSLKQSKTTNLVVEFINDYDGRILYVDERHVVPGYFVSDEIKENWVERNDNKVWKDISNAELQKLKDEQFKRIEADKSDETKFELNERVLFKSNKELCEAKYKGITNFGDIIVELDDSKLVIVKNIEKFKNSTKEDVIKEINYLITNHLYEYSDDLQKVIRLVQRLKD